MSEYEPEGPYVYQPFGIQHAEHWEAERIFAIGGFHQLATIEGLTRAEADAVVRALKETETQ